jgi:hypothetical protein
MSPVFREVNQCSDSVLDCYYDTGCKILQPHDHWKMNLLGAAEIGLDPDVPYVQRSQSVFGKSIYYYYDTSCKCVHSHFNYNVLYLIQI